MELVDMRDLGSRAFSVWVRVPSGAPWSLACANDHFYMRLSNVKIWFRIKWKLGLSKTPI